MSEPKHQIKKEEKTGKKLAAVLVRGTVNIESDIKHTLLLLRLRRKHACVVLEDSPVNRGRLQKVKDYVTWGEITDTLLSALLQKRGRQNPEQKKKYKPFFRLQPPRKGFERKGIKKPFAFGGALGYRGEKINDLLERML